MIIFLIAICLCIVYYEKKKWNSLSSPAVLMSFSYLGAVICGVIGNSFYNYYTISHKVYFLLSLSILAFWLPSLLFNLKKRKVIAKREKVVFSEYSFFLLAFSLLAFFSVNLIRGRGLSVGSEEFEEIYSHGINAHLRNLLIVLFTYFLCFKRNTFIIIVIKIGSFILIFISGTKYHIIFPFLIWFVFFLHQNKSLKKIFFLSLRALFVIFILFSTNYYIGFHLRGTFNEDHNFYDFVFNHFLTYISGGFISVSEILKKNYIDIGVFYNNMQIPFDVFVSISQTSKVSNVRGLFGTYLLSYGYLFTYMFFFILGLVFYYLYIMMLKSGNKYYFLAYGFFIASPMILSFFASYYRLLNIWEYTFFSFLLQIIFLLINESIKIVQPQSSQIMRKCNK
jgi:oligosaccharide repeat unit polymerase